MKILLAAGGHMDSERRYWLEEKWRNTSRILLFVIRKHALDLYTKLRDGDQLDGSNWTQFVDAVRHEIGDRWASAQRRRSATFGRESYFYLYDAAMSLLTDLEPIRRELLTARRRIDPDDPAGVLYPACRRGLISMRHIAIGGTLHIGKLWSRLDVLSRQVYDRQSAEAGTELPFGRRDERHINALFAHIQALRASKLAEGRKESNLPRDIDTVWEYFSVFYREDDETMDPTLPDPTTIAEEGIRNIPGYQDMREKVRLLLRRLSDELRAVVLVALDLPESEFDDKDEHCRVTGISSDRFDELYAEALSRMATGLRDMEWSDQ